MNPSITIDLKNIEGDVINDVLEKVEQSFGFKFGRYELKDVETFGELCDIIVDKVQGASATDCTTQQAFYKLRDAIVTTLSITKYSVTTHTPLHELFPRTDRRQQIKSVEQILGLKMNALRPKHWITTVLFLSFLASLVALAIAWQMGLAGLAFSVAGLYVSGELGKELDLITVGELAEKIARENYKKVRRNPKTVNRTEVAEKVKELFLADPDVEEYLTRQATFS